MFLLFLSAENCGYLKIHRRFPLYDGAKTLLAALPNICKRLQEQGIQYDQELLPATYDVTSCYRGTEEGGYIVDFLSHVMHFDKMAPEELKEEFMEYVRSTECATVDCDKVLLNADETALIIERKGWLLYMVDIFQITEYFFNKTGYLIMIFQNNVAQLCRPC